MRSKFIFSSVTGFLFFAAVAEPDFGGEITGKNHMLSEMTTTGNSAADRSSRNSKRITIFMSGDVMTGRGIDQVLPHPGDPLIHESYMKSAAGYVKIAEEVNGPIQQPVSFSYIWGDALEELDRVAPELTQLTGLQPALGLHAGHCTAACCYDCLMIVGILNITAGKNTFYIRACRSWFGDDVPAYIQVEEFSK